jgi:hypothetical protein
MQPFGKDDLIGLTFFFMGAVFAVWLWSMV